MHEFTRAKTKPSGENVAARLKEAGQADNISSKQLLDSDSESKPEPNNTSLF